MYFCSTRSSAYGPLPLTEKKLISLFKKVQVLFLSCSYQLLRNFDNPINNNRKITTVHKGINLLVALTVTP